MGFEAGFQTNAASKLQRAQGDLCPEIAYALLAGRRRRGTASSDRASKAVRDPKVRIEGMQARVGEPDLLPR